MSKNVLVVGSINIDYVIHTARLPKLGETLTGSDFAMNFGGKGANQAVALARVGCDVRMLGAVGNDLAADLAVRNLTESGVDASHVLRVEAPTGAAVITVCGGDNHILLDVGANGFVTPAVIRDNEELYRWADVVVMQYEIPTESVLESAKLAKKHGKTVLLNPAPAKEVAPELFGLVDWIIPNEFEAQLLTGVFPADDASAERTLAALTGLGCRNALVTLGKRGCAYRADGRVGYAGIYPVTPVDTTAAGDSFIGGFCAKLCEGKPVAEAVAYASAVSAIAVSRPGAAVSIPSASEVEEFLNTHRMEPRA